VITAAAAWNAKNALSAKKPIFVLAISGQSTVYSTHDLSREGITGTLPSYEPWLRTPTGSTQTVDVQAGTSDIGELQCEVVDHGGAVRTLVGTTTLEGQLATVLVGYPGIDYTEFVTLCAHRIYKVNPSAGFSSFLINAKDIQMDSKRTIWNHPLNGDPLSSDNPWVIQGTPSELIQAVWLLALGNPTSTLDIATLNRLDSPVENLYACARPFLFEMDQPFAAKDFLENQIYKPSGMYPVVTNTGQMSVRAYRPFAAGTSPVFAFTADNVTVYPQIDRLQVLNDLLWQIDNRAQYSNPDYATTLLYLDATSITTFGRSNERQVQSAGLRTELGAQWFAQDISQRMFARFAGTTGLRGAAPVITIQAFFMTLPVWVGDYVTLSHPKMPDLFTGALGVTDRVFEVIDRTPNYSGGKMSFKLLDTGLTGAPAATTVDDAVIDTTPIY
jgi:hypothetical protein